MSLFGFGFGFELKVGWLLRDGRGVWGRLGTAGRGRVGVGPLGGCRKREI